MTEAERIANGLEFMMDYDDEFDSEEYIADMEDRWEMMEAELLWRE